MKQYLDLMKHILENGEDRVDQTKVATRSVFGAQMRFKMSDGFPAVTTKKLAFNQVKAELLWFLSGSSDIHDLQKMGCHIWDINYESDWWKDKRRFDGDLGRVYGVQWRTWAAPDGKTVDQIRKALDDIKNNSDSRRIIVTAWNPGELNQMALPPCHMIFQFYVANGKLSLHMYQRSADMFLGVPFNIASYSTLLCLVAKVTKLEPNEFIHTLGDAHVYENHFDQVKEQFKRDPKSLPQLWMNPKIKNLEDFTIEDIELKNYSHHQPIKAEMINTSRKT